MSFLWHSSSNPKGFCNSYKREKKKWAILQRLKRKYVWPDLAHYKVPGNVLFLRDALLKLCYFIPEEKFCHSLASLVLSQMKLVLTGGRVCTVSAGCILGEARRLLLQAAGCCCCCRIWANQSWGCYVLGLCQFWAALCAPRLDLNSQDLGRFSFWGKMRRICHD